MAEPALSSRLRVPEDVLFRNIDGEAVLVNLTSAIYFGLDEVGTRIWELIQERRTLQGVLDGVMAAYVVDESRARADLLRLAEELVAKQLLVVAGPEKE